MEESETPQPVVQTQKPHRIEMRHEDPAKGLRPELSVEDFRANNSYVLSNLPTVEDIRRNPHKEDYHETPSAIVNAGKPLGKILETMKSNPIYVDAGLEFYKNCANHTDVVVEIKALCLRNFRDWNEKLGRKERSRFATDVERLAGKIPKTRF